MRVAVTVVVVGCLIRWLALSPEARRLLVTLCHSCVTLALNAPTSRVVQVRGWSGDVGPRSWVLRLTGEKSILVVFFVGGHTPHQWRRTSNEWSCLAWHGMALHGVLSASSHGSCRESRVESRVVKNRIDPERGKNIQATGNSGPRHRHFSAAVWWTSGPLQWLWGC